MRAAADTAWGRISVEMRSLNHRFTEVLVRLPRDLAPLEDRVRGVVQRGIRLARVEALLGQVLGRAVQVVGEYTVRLRQRLAELLGEVPLDEARLAAELALFAERSDITEELTRPGSHTHP